MQHLDAKSFLITLSLFVCASCPGWAQIKPTPLDKNAQKPTQPAGKKETTPAYADPAKETPPKPGADSEVSDQTKPVKEISEKQTKIITPTENKSLKTDTAIPGAKAPELTKENDPEKIQPAKSPQHQINSPSVSPDKDKIKSGGTQPTDLKKSPGKEYLNDTPVQSGEEKQYVFSKTFPALHADGLVASEIFIACESKNRCNARLTLRLNPSLPPSGEKYREFKLLRPEINSVHYQLRIQGTNLEKSENVWPHELASGHRRDFSFYTPEALDESLSPRLKIEVELTGGGYGPTVAAVDAYYLACEEMKQLADKLKSMQVGAQDVLTAKMETIESCVNRAKELKQDEFIGRLQLTPALDPGRFLYFIDQIGTGSREKELACLKEALRRIQTAELSLKAMKIADPEQFEVNNKELSRLESSIKSAAGLRFNPNNSLLGPHLEIYYKKSQQLDGVFKTTKDSVAVVGSKLHEAYFKRAMSTTMDHERRRHLQSAINAAPRPFAEPHYELALMEYKDNNYDKSLSRLDNALSATPKQDTYDKCIQLYNRIYKALLSEGDMAYGEKAIEQYAYARRVCENRNIPVDCGIATFKIRNARTQIFSGILIGGRNAWDFAGVARARDYFNDHREEIEGDKLIEINRAFSELVDKRFNIATSLYQQRDYPDAWEELLDIKKQEQRYQIEDRYPQRWENLAKTIFEGSLLDAESYSRRDSFQMAAPLVELCKNMRGDARYQFLFYLDEHAFNSLYARAQTGLFTFRLQVADESIKKDDFEEADDLLKKAEAQQSTPEADWWLEVSLRDELKSKRAQLASARFYYLENKVNEHIAARQLYEAEKGLQALIQRFQQDSAWLSAENHGKVLHLTSGKYNTAKTLEWVQIGRVKLGSGNRQGVSEALIAAKSLLEQPQESAVMAREVFNSLRADFTDRYFSEVNALLDSVGESQTDTAAIFRLQNHHNDIRQFTEKGVIAIEKETHEAIFERLRKKIFAEDCRQCWNRFDSEMKSAEETVKSAAFIQACQHAQNALDALKDKPNCKLDQSAAEKLLTKYRPAAEYQKRKTIMEQSLKNRDYQNVLDNYPIMDSIFTNYGLSELNIRHLAFIEMVKLENDRNLISFIVSRYYNLPAKKGLIMRLLSKEILKKSADLQLIGLEVGKHLKNSGLIATQEEVLNMHRLESSKFDRAFKKGLKKGLKTP